jgi:hypothetical protein
MTDADRREPNRGAFRARPASLLPAFLCAALLCLRADCPCAACLLRSLAVGQ